MNTENFSNKMIEAQLNRLNKDSIYGNYFSKKSSTVAPLGPILSGTERSSTTLQGPKLKLKKEHFTEVKPKHEQRDLLSYVESQIYQLQKMSNYIAVDGLQIDSESENPS